MTASPTDDHASAERRIQELTKELVESREQQAATAGILRAISNSPSDLHSIFQEITATAARFCDAHDAGVLQCAGDHLKLVAHRGSIPIGGQFIPLRRGLVMGRAVLDRAIIHVTDLQAETEEYPEGTEIARRDGHRTLLGVPLICAREAIGVIFVRRTAVRPFTDRQIDLLKTFADQAVIAIENARLFTELREKNGALTQAHAQVTETLEQQTATSEILRVISSSPTDIQPVFDAIIANAMRLCEGEQCVLLGREGGTITFLASHHYRPEGQTAVRAVLPRPLSRDTTAGRAILERKTVQISDVLDDSEYGPKHLATVAQYRATISVPMMREGEAIGAVTVTREAPGEFSPRQIELLHTFADQAVIAIGNTRLFEAEQASKLQLQESLEYQTAMGEVLGVIARAPGD